MTNKRQVGGAYEALAMSYLERQGCRIVCRNFYCRQGEIDLIVRDGRYLVFVEVKYRQKDGMGHPAEAVDKRKQRRICRAAAYYCYTHGVPQGQPCRFDVVSILGEDIEHIKHAFEMQ